MFEMFKFLFRPAHSPQTSDARTRLFETMESRRFLSGSGGETQTEPDPGTTDPVITEPEEPVDEVADPGLNDGEAFRDRIKDRLGHEEGRKPGAYRDNADTNGDGVVDPDEGYWTIGIGHNVETDEGEIEAVTGHPKEDYIPQADTNGDGFINGEDSAQRTLTEDEIDRLFEQDYQEHLDKALQEVPNLADLDPTVQEAVVDFVYNNGSMTEFPSMRAALRAGDYREAAWQMSHFDGSEDSLKSQYFTKFEPTAEGYPGNDRARVNIKALNDAADAAGQPPKFGWWNDVDDEKPTE